jgi:hypothetical protein
MRAKERIAQRAYDIAASTVNAVKTFAVAPAFNALPTGTAVSSGISPSTLAARDSGSNISAANFLSSQQAITTNGTNHVLDGTKAVIIIGGTTAGDSFQLPTTFIFVPQTVKLINKSTQPVAINASNGSLVKTLAAGASTICTCVQNTPTTPAHWDAT